MLKHPEEVLCRCGLKQVVHKSYVVCVSCGNPLLMKKPTPPKCHVRLRGGVVVASRYIEKSGVVEDVIVYGKFNHPKAVDGVLVSGLVAHYKRSDTPNVRVQLFGGKAKILALHPINKGEEIRIGVGD